MSKNILIAEDEEDMRHLINLHLKKQGYQIIQATDGQEAINKINTSVDLVLLDIMMPKRSGLEVCESIRQEVDCPIVFISAASDEMNRIKALSLGGDDFISKPFSLEELTLKIEAIFKMKERFLDSYEKEKRKRIFIDDLEVDLLSRKISYKMNPIPFTKKEYDLLVMLLSSPRQVFTKEQIYNHISGIEGIGDVQSVVEHVKNVRHKLADFGYKYDYLQTVWGIGYQWKNH
ncbi:response regulator transcription factor [Virgibacillus sp. NKC19-3]|uniref:response regulator transcription factor n=1 Tax=Virgibacillus saliphilus TaxID=2831674 RepID=UPI001C9AB38D|nr:response regulator transcription factor [Virgibacillus sp. NKC19-3]MBY7141829.1 response regulator transcription factor [Virgibacillus sp. NKC19-3]